MLYTLEYSLDLEILVVLSSMKHLNDRSIVLVKELERDGCFGLVSVETDGDFALWAHTFDDT